MGLPFWLKWLQQSSCRAWWESLCSAHGRLLAGTLAGVIEDWLTLQDFGQLIPVCTGTEYAIKRRPRTQADMGELCESEAESIPDGA